MAHPHPFTVVDERIARAKDRYIKDFQLGSPTDLRARCEFCLGKVSFAILAKLSEDEIYQLVLAFNTAWMAGSIDATAKAIQTMRT